MLMTVCQLFLEPLSLISNYFNACFFLFPLSYQISRKGIVEHFIKEVLHLNIRTAIFELVNTFSFVKANIIWILLLLLLVFTLVLESYWIGERSLVKGILNCRIPSVLKKPSIRR